MRIITPFKKSLLAQALAAMAAAAVLPAQASIVTGGLVNPDPSSGTVSGALSIGTTGAGSVAVNAGSGLTADRLWLGTGTAGDGALTITGAGSSFLATMGSTAASGLFEVKIGDQGRGNVSILNGASFVAGASSDANCRLNCRIFLSTGAGSDGSLTVNGTGSSFSTPGGMVVGNAAVFTQATDGFNFGTPGGASQGRVRIEAGGAITTSFVTIGGTGAGLGRTGTETTNGGVLLDGSGSVWNVLRNTAQTGGWALVNLGTGSNATGSLEVRNGATMRVDGSSASGEFSGIHVAGRPSGSNNSNVNASLLITGPGSRIDVDGGVGFINVGRGNGTTASLTISNGGVMAGSGGGGERGLAFATFGAGGGTGSGTITGTNSLLRLNGRNSATNSDPTAVLNGGAFLSVGRAGSGSAGHGTLDISAGGRMQIDTTGLVLTNPNGQTGMYVGFGVGSTGVLNVSGAGSRLDINADSGLTPYIAIGRDGATGSLAISGGGRVEVSSSHLSVPNPGVYLPGDVLIFDIGRRVSTADNTLSSGTVTVSGIGSELALTGAADNFISVGRGNNATGTLNVNSGGVVRAKSMLVGTEANATGVLNMNAGQLVLNGVINGGPAASFGTGLGIGRADSVGIADIGNGSTVSISSTSPQSSISIGGTGTAPGGTGTMNVTGGSTVSVSGPDAFVAVGRSASATQAGIGTLSISGAGSSVSVSGSNGNVRIAAGANTFGVLNIGAGASLSATSLVGVAHNGTANTGGSGVLVVNGSLNATTLVNGTAGVLSGSGVINANVTNLGTINPGNSPGRLTLNGAFDNSAGRIVLEVQSLGNGQFAYDEIVFGDTSNIVLGQGAIEFVFLGDANPLAFLGAGLFDLDTFFKEVNALGAVVGLDNAHRSWFQSSLFSASAAAYNITNFVFDPHSGASFNATAIPAPQSLALALLALALLAASTRRRARPSAQH